MGFRQPDKEMYAKIIGDNEPNGMNLTGMSVLVKVRPITRAYYERLVTSRDDEAFSVFLDDIVKEWNLEDADGPIPPSSDALARIDVSVLSAILRGWLIAMASLPLAASVRHELGAIPTPATPPHGS